jgi:hypothetical protein
MELLAWKLLYSLISDTTCMKNDLKMNYYEIKLHLCDFVH